MNNKFETLDFYTLSKNKKRYSEGGLRKNSVKKISLPNKPLITIITVVFNGDKYLQETIDSIKKYIDAGVEKVILNSAAVKNPNLISEASRKAQRIQAITLTSFGNR